MNRTKFFVLFAFSAMFFACGSQDEGGGPPELKNSQIGFKSPLDTIVAEFNSKIVDVDKLNEDNIIMSDNIIHVKKESSDKLYFVGKNTAANGLKYFEPNKDWSITFRNIKNDDGYIQKETVLYFTTYPILDGTDNNESNPDDIAQWLGRASLTNAKGVTFAGDIGIDIAKEWADFNDYFTLSLKAYDSLSITLSNTKNKDVNLELIIPLDTKAPVKATEKDDEKFIEYKMDYEDFYNTIGIDEQVQFKIKISSEGKLTPYLLTVKVIEKK